ncbi:hypothetical protein DET54_102690 [Paenibacillus pabuli]|uniref:Uncharacterized protein n=1 Tax=Paenibacillus pabuli TaxID=1472 RepID=A0A855XTJ9_9BACL|nr:hypothetical protein DET56_10631 [Paenibacillus pabuli]PXW06887.1 hypothetical protein DEU73_106403 [Paenibacillus taichungensis]RAJ01202.1 hypothetical protein DET54_102690 [Paenibacillus pabuli]SEN20673.1 hypothetical protein SAMN05518670_1313 [Paenibacillus sp. OK076]
MSALFGVEVAISAEKLVLSPLCMYMVTLTMYREAL